MKILATCGGILVSKFNPYHDRGTGEFSSGGGAKPERFEPKKSWSHSGPSPWNAGTKPSVEDYTRSVMARRTVDSVRLGDSERTVGDAVKYLNGFNVNRSVPLEQISADNRMMKSSARKFAKNIASNSQGAARYVETYDLKQLQWTVPRRELVDRIRWSAHLRTLVGAEDGPYNPYKG